VTYLQAVEQVMRIAAFALDSLVAAGVEITPEQYRNALVDAGRRAGGRGSGQVPLEYEEAREAAIRLVLEEEESIYRERVEATEGG
jgi:hypothetical protein